MNLIRLVSVGKPVIQKKTRAGKTPARQPNRSGSGDPHLQTLPYTPYVAGDRLIASGTESGSRTCQDQAILTYRDRGRIRRSGPTTPRRWRSPDRHRDRIRRCCFYFACFTSPNVFNARCAGDTGPRNRRVINVSGLPPNETSSI